jgi:hypothetical protein
MPMMKILSLSLALTLLGCGGSSGSKNDGGTGDDLSVTTPALTNFASINSHVLQPSCTFSTCHSPDGARTSDMLNLKDDGTSAAGSIAFAALVNQPAVNAKAAAAGLVLVTPCDATDSFLVTKLTLAHDLNVVSDYGARMPSGNAALPAAQIQAIEDWINRGALQDEPATVSGSKCTITADGGQ